MNAVPFEISVDLYFWLIDRVIIEDDFKNKVEQD